MGERDFYTDIEDVSNGMVTRKNFVTGLLIADFGFMPLANSQDKRSCSEVYTSQKDILFNENDFN